MKKLKQYSALLFSAAVLICLFSFSSLAAEKEPLAGKVITESGNLNIRSSPSLSGKIVASAKRNSYITLTDSTDSWWKVRYKDNSYGWCHKDYIKVITKAVTATVNTKSGNLNVRSSRSTSAGIKTRLPKGYRLLVLSQKDSWSKIVYNGNSMGFVYTPYLSFKSEESHIKLDVPYYKQTDSRWSSVSIGTTGGTIGSIGCTTTCLAMTESYHSSSAVTPDLMKKRLSYTASGSLFWPQDYATALLSYDFSQTMLLDLLNKGTPVIFGAAKQNGSGQHWVVITGFNGDKSNPDLSDFIINDPGSSYRKTLASLLKDYPQPYKIAYRR